MRNCYYYRWIIKIVVLTWAILDCEVFQIMQNDNNLVQNTQQNKISYSWTYNTIIWNFSSNFAIKLKQSDKQQTMTSCIIQTVNWPAINVNKFIQTLTTGQTCKFRSTGSQTHLYVCSDNMRIANRIKLEITNHRRQDYKSKQFPVIIRDLSESFQTINYQQWQKSGDCQLVSE